MSTRKQSDKPDVNPNDKIAEASARSIGYTDQAKAAESGRQEGGQ